MKNTFRFLLVVFSVFSLTANEAKADILNGSFNNASQNWKTQQNFYCTNSGFTAYRTSPGYAWFASSDGSAKDNIWGTLTQSFTMPSLFSSASVDFYTRITTAEVTTSSPYDYMNCTITDGTTSQTSQIKLSNLDASSGYIKHTISIPTAMAGHTLTLTFYAENDGAKPTVFRIDDVSLTIDAAPTASITVTLPNGGESWEIGSAKTITWSSANLSGNVKVEINGNYPTLGWEVLYSSIPNDGSEPWTVSGQAGTAKRIRVTSVNNTNISDISNSNFTMTDPPVASITVTSPNGGESWEIGSAKTILWTSNNLSGNVKIEINGNYPTLGWEVLYSSIPNDGSEPWNVSGQAGTAKRIRVTSVNNTNISDISNSNFTMTDPPVASITVTSPNGGEIWEIGSAKTITWTSNNLPGNVKVEINGNYPTLGWEVLYSSIPNDGSEPWTVSGQAGTAKRIRVTSVNNTNVSDISNSNFTMTDPPTISQIQWSGYTWDVKSGTGTRPGPNNWLANSSSVLVDGNGDLHLKIRKIGDNWYCAEIFSQQSLGYGEYTFQVSTNVENLDKNIVLGLFTYEDDSKEIDLEFSRWGVASDPVGWYVVQPSSTSSRNNFPLNLTGSYSTHKFNWSPSEIYFQSYHGHSTDYLINQWSYKGSYNPPAGNEKVHLNLWLNKGEAPSNQQEAEVIIKSFTFKKVESTITITSPNGGENWQIGSTKNITWSSSNFTGNVNIEVNGNYPDGQWDPLRVNTPNDGSESLLITGQAGNAKRIRITSVNNPIISDISDGNFTYQSPLTVIAKDGSALGSKKPLLLIHGIQLNGMPSDPDITLWNNFVSYYDQDQNLKDKFKIYYVRYYSNLVSVADLGYELRLELDKKTEFEGKLISIVAHSMGGLVSRAFMNRTVNGTKGGERIEKLVTLGTPHHGSPMSNGPARFSALEPITATLIFAADQLLYPPGNPSYYQYNRSDLRWDNYDNLFDYNKYVEERNDWLAGSAMNNDRTYDNKIIAYAGSFDILDFDTKYAALDLLTSNMFIWKFSRHELTDGIVPYSSASFGGHTLKKIRFFKGYNHSKLPSGIKGIDQVLFGTLKADLLEETPIAILKSFPDETWDYGDLAVNGYNDKIFELQNMGTKELTVTGITILGTNSDQFKIINPTNTIFTLAVGVTQEVIVRFTPTSTGLKSANLLIANNSDNASPNKSINLSGTGATVPQTYTVATSSNPANGGATNGGGTYNSGQSVTVTATPNGGYTFSNWTENGTVVSTSSSYTFTISSGRILVANFALIPPTQYSVNLSSNPANGGATSGGGAYNSGNSVTVTATANSGYTFTNWTEGGTVVSTNSSYTFTMPNNDINLRANFAINTYTLTITSTNGTVTKNPNQTNYASGSTIQLTATPSTGYTFTGWSGDASGNQNPMTITMNASKNITANFSLISTPTIIVSTTSLPDFGSLQVGTNSSPQSYTLSGSNLSSNITITAPPSFQISTSSNSGFGSSLSLTQSGGSVPNITIYVRFSPTNSGIQSGNISHTSTGATAKNVTVSGTGTTILSPTIIVSTTSLPDFGSVLVGQYSSSPKYYTVSGSNLTSDITITASPEFQISTSSNSGFGSLLSLSQSGGTVSSTIIYVRFSPTSLGFHSGNILHTSAGTADKYVSISGTGISSQTAGEWKILGTIALSGNEYVRHIAISGNRAFITRSGAKMTVIDLNSNSELTNISFSTYSNSSPGFVTIAGNKAYITLSNLGSNGQLAVIDINNYSIINYIPVGVDPYGVTTYNNKVYVTNNVWWTNGDPATVKVINMNTNMVDATIPVGINPNCIAIDPITGKAFVTNGNSLSKSVSVINTATNSVITSVLMPNEPRGVAISGNRAYVSNGVNYPSGTVEVIDITSNSVTASLPVGRDAVGIAATPTYVFVANQSSNTVSIIDVTSNSVVSTLNVGNDPYDIAIDFNTNKVYVTNQLDKTISIIGQEQTYTINGYIRTSNGIGISNVVMNGFPNNTSTDENGYYSAIVAQGWSGTVTPTKNGYAFSPINNSYNNVTSNQSANYTGTIQGFTISGYVRTSSGSGITDVAMNGLPGNLSTDTSGYYSGTVDYGWSGKVTPTKNGYAFSPINNSYNNVTSNQSANYTGTIQGFTISGYVRTSSGSGITDVAMNGLPGNLNTDASGYYSGTVDYGWSGNVIPSKSNYTFYPVSQSLSNVTSNLSKDFTGIIQGFTISGYIRTSNGNTISNVAMNGLPNNTITGQSGYYSGTVDYGWSGTVTPFKSGYTFSPVSQYYNNVFTNEITNYVGNNTTDIEKITGIIPDYYDLFQNYPNPFNPSTTIKFALPEPVFVRLKIYDLTGRTIETLVDELLNSGIYEVKWNSNGVTSGIYIYQLNAGGYTNSKKIILLK